MTDEPVTEIERLRGALIDSLRAARGLEREVLDALSPAGRDAPLAGEAWSPKDVQTHLAAWRRHQAERLAARREDRDAPPETPAVETDAANAVIHAERADWTWDRVLTDADAASDALIEEIRAADSTVITEDRTVGSTLGNGLEHDLAHLPALAARVGMTDRLLEVAGDLEASVGRGDWPPRASAFARYNLACFHALAGRLDEARGLLRLALPANEELRGFAPADADLVALRDEIDDLSAG